MVNLWEWARETNAPDLNEGEFPFYASDINTGEPIMVDGQVQRFVGNANNVKVQLFYDYDTDPYVNRNSLSLPTDAPNNKLEYNYKNGTTGREGKNSIFINPETFAQDQTIFVVVKIPHREETNESMIRGALLGAFFDACMIPEHSNDYNNQQDLALDSAGRINLAAYGLPKNQQEKFVQMQGPAWLFTTLLLTK